MWQKVSSLKRKISSPRADEHSDFNACSTSSVAEKGHFFVYTSEGKRFMVPLAYLDNNIFKELLKISEEEFGLPGDGPITLPCDAASMETEHVDWQEMKMELSNALSTSLDTPLLSKDNTYSMDAASQGNVIGPILAKPNSSADIFKSSLKISLSSHWSCNQDNHNFHIHQALIPIDITEMAKTWQKVAGLRRKISSPRADACSDFNSCSTSSSVAEKGHFNVYTLEGKRFMVPLAYLDNNIFKELLRISEEEFGLPCGGPITLPCDAASMDYVLSLLRRGVSKEMEVALLSSIFISCQSTCSVLSVEHNPQQLSVCSF
ncbi:hypothetical protein J5N97_029140 [Dioscorea zingiberensis]|uniref:Uncharacterized protein n=1 Tax=Dioscorea zingiberensis TaxID=325984 RepID=A0A9D5C077_9LILI|nr:hypothetical protein J5N97_029140 [Dioscorea zingiberensis]